MGMPLIGLITSGVSAALQAQQGQIDAGLLRQQAKTSRQQGVADADSLSRDLRQLLGSQAASMAQAGGSYTGSNAKLISQSETLGNLDRLKTLYRGELRARELEIDAKQTLRKAYIGAGTQLMTSFGGGFGGGMGGGGR